MEWTQAEAAKAFGMSLSRYQEMEAGRAVINKRTELSCAATERGILNYRPKPKRRNEMYKIILLGAASIMMSACTTPTTVMQNPKTGEVVSCGGEIGSDYVYAVGPVGSYLVERHKNSKCVQSYAHDGYIISGVAP